MEEHLFQSTFLTALQAISLAVFSVRTPFCVHRVVGLIRLWCQVILKKLGASWQRMRLNCLRRYKWAFIDEYEDIDRSPVGHPNFLKFTAACSAIQQVG